MPLEKLSSGETGRPWEQLLTSEHYQETLEKLSGVKFSELRPKKKNLYDPESYKLKPVQIFEYVDGKLVFIHRFGARCPAPSRDEILARLDLFRPHLENLEGIPSNKLEVIPVPRLLIDGFEDVDQLTNNSVVRWDGWSNLQKLKSDMLGELVHPDPRIRAFAAWDILVVEKEVSEPTVKTRIATLQKKNGSDGKVNAHRPWLNLDLAEAVLLRKSGMIGGREGKVEVLLGQYSSKKRAFLGVYQWDGELNVASISEEFAVGDPFLHRYGATEQQEIFARRGLRLSNSHLRR